MSRISRHALATAIARVRAKDLKQKEHLGDELFREQPHLLASFLVQRQFGVSLAKCEFLPEVILICFQAMKESGINWPLITEDDQERQMRRLTASIKFGTDLRGDLRDRALRQHLDAHPEKDLLAFVQAETAMWLERVEPEESDKYVMMAALNVVSCIAYVPLQE